MTSENIKPAGKTSVFAHPAVLCLLLVAVTLAVYWPVMRCDFVNYDDPAYFTSNVHVQTGLTLPNIVWTFSTRQTANWHPLTWLSLMLDVELFGDGPIGPHFTNLLFHLANTVLVFLLLRRLTAANWRSAFVAALFALHPLHVESVAWIAERKDVLSTFFGLLSLWAYACHAQRVTGDQPSPGFGAAGTCRVTRMESILSRVTCHVSRFYWLAVFFFTLGLMSKPMLVTLPFVMLLLDWWPLRRVAGDKWQMTGIARLVWEKIPFFVLSAISCVVTLIAQQKGGSVVSLMNISLTGRIENVFVSYARYLGKTFWPVNLAVLYPHPGHWAAGMVVFSLMLVIGLSVAAVRIGRGLPFVFTGWFWFVGTLIPVIGLVQVGNQSMADRYTYVPMIGLFIILAWGLGESCASRRLPRQLMIMAALFLLVASALRTRDQISHWQNSETLFRHTLAVTQNNSIAYNDLGTYLSKRGQMTEAMDCFTKSLQINPDNSDVLYNLGNALAKSGNLDGAVDNYRRALQIAPTRTDILNNLGIVLARREQFADAAACFEKALKLKPDEAVTHNNFAMALFIQKRFDEAARHYREALRLQPGNPQIYGNLGDALVKQGQTAEAARCYQEALRLNPGYSQIKAKLQALDAPISN
jgi:Flp pilus assembly protein TadD